MTIDAHNPASLPVSSDTASAAEAVLFKLLAETPTWRKFELLDDLNRSARILAMAGLRRRHPNASESELRRRLADLMLGAELAEHLYGAYRAILRQCQPSWCDSSPEA
ncbi:MAG: hypothetical protein M9918_23945 [Anaerolineae bacterium]|nr:hypothetical protein [Anaerolineae bacterium]MCO5193153.1 hypothetical protein [Anaerolineae bacterium]